jgi:hypothetical protein
MRGKYSKYKEECQDEFARQVRKCEGGKVKKKASYKYQVSRSGCLSS